MDGPVRLVCIPSRDAVFAADAERIAREIPHDLPSEDALAWYAAALRRSYPGAEVHEQDALARHAPDDRVWYVSRREQHFRIDTEVVVPLRRPDAYRAYVERVVEWQTAVQLTPRGETGEIVGREYDAYYTFLGRTYEGRFRVLAAEPPFSIAMEAQGSGISVWYEARFEPDPGGTRVAVRGDYELPARILTRIADRLGLERAIARDIERANQTYRVICESEAPRGSGVG